MLGLIYGANWADILASICALLAVPGVAFAGMQVYDARRKYGESIVMEYVRRWDSAEMAQARRLVGSFVALPDEVESLRRAVRSSYQRASDDYLLFARYLSFFEGLGVAVGRNRRLTALVDRYMGSTVIKAWLGWQSVIPYVWGPETEVGLAFGEPEVLKLSTRIGAADALHPVSPVRTVEELIGFWRSPPRRANCIQTLKSDVRFSTRAPYSPATPLSRERSWLSTSMQPRSSSARTSRKRIASMECPC